MPRRQLRRPNTPKPDQRAAPPRSWLAAAALVIVAVAGISVWLAFGLTGGEDGLPRAVIIDQLEFNIPNENFVLQATGLLEQAGYEVDYFASDRIDVDFYRALPSKGYDFILFRAHADRLEATADDGTKFDDVVLFTSEQYDREKYTPDQAANRLVIAKYQPDGEEFFGVAPGFFESARGNFGGATLVVMGCEGFLTERTAQAFVEDMGAKTYISWNETVSSTHTDEATEVLLRHMLIDGKSAPDAVALTMADVGPDPIYGSRLKAYPPEG